MTIPKIHRQSRIIVKHKQLYPLRLLCPLPKILKPVRELGLLVIQSLKVTPLVPVEHRLAKPHRRRFLTPIRDANVFANASQIAQSATIQ